MKCLVTGAAGFIGSHLCERLLRSGHTVAGIDAFIPYYPRAVKEANLAAARGFREFAFHALDLRTDPLEPLMEGVEIVFHLAAMAGLPKSWTDFDLYQSCNLVGTQRLLETVRRLPQPPRFVHASTSSVYGRFSAGDETLPTRPISPYGVTKLAAEHLCRAYADEHGLPLTVLRYFSVYGPRQRPDMGYHRFIRALLTGEDVTVYGDGQQVRSNTYISDCVDATVAATGAIPGEVYNVGSGEAVNVWEVLGKLESITGRKAAVRREPGRAGDQRCTCADTTKLRRHLGWEPQVSLEEGLAQQVAWQELEVQRPLPPG
ncbi:MAG TPA: NAD-dependent epimerase/dehydratase family protein [Gemmataceae bacterium]|jgi:nucleoside-diphosphate-sugar epimerase|nr:NAD-dependent epimerase/dehydratase family protein [Gemmataceae bacterium]